MVLITVQDISFNDMSLYTAGVQRPPAMGATPPDFRFVTLAYYCSFRQECVFTVFFYFYFILLLFYYFEK